MGDYVQSSEISARAGNRLLTEDTVPSLTDVDQWIDEAEGELLGTLDSVGIPSTYASGTRGFKIIRGWVGNYVAGIFRVSYAAAAGDGANEDGRFLLENWQALLKQIRMDPDGVSAMLNAGGSSATATLGVSSHITDSTLGYSEDDTESAYTFDVGGSAW